jgi:nitroreductase
MSLSLSAADEPEVRAVAELIRNRRTINLFTPEPVAKEVVLEAIELARWAPNHRLTEPWRFYLFGPETAAAAAECWSDFEAELKGEAAGIARRKRLAGIPGHFVLTSARDEDSLIELENYAATSCAAQNLMLYLWQRGVGVKWTTGAITREPRMYELLGIDAELERIAGYFWYGRPRVIARQRRRSVDEIVVELD